MKIRINSNFVIPGFEGKDEMNLKSSKVTLWMVLEELSSKSLGRVKFIRPMMDAVDPMDFTIEINGFPNPGSREALETGLNEGDLITIKLSALGGG